jgi:hypothetical protein
MEPLAGSLIILAVSTHVRKYGASGEVRQLRLPQCGHTRQDIRKQALERDDHIHLGAAMRPPFIPEALVK